jgi:hypothetical protein
MRVHIRRLRVVSQRCRARAGVVPPAQRGCSLGSGRRWDSQFAQLRIDLGAALPLLKPQRTQAVTDSLVVLGEDLRSIRQSEVLLPSRQVGCCPEPGIACHARDTITGCPETLAFHSQLEF